MKKLNNVKMIFVDIDGTLTNSKNEITDYTKEIIKQTILKGIHVIIATGRPNQYAVEISRRSGATPIVISSNGTLIFNYKQNKEIYESKIDSNVIEDIWNLSVQNNVDIKLNSTYTRFTNNQLENDAIVVSSAEEINDNITQIVPYTRISYDGIKKLKKYVEESEKVDLKNIAFNLLKEEKDSDGEFWMDVANKGNNKGTAVEKLLKYFQIDSDDVICFGDSFNDKEMFQVCGNGIAMQNAMNEIKEISDFITLSNDDSGVAKFIEEYIL